MQSDRLTRVLPHDGDKTLSGKTSLRICDRSHLRELHAGATSRRPPEIEDRASRYDNRPVQSNAASARRSGLAAA